MTYEVIILGHLHMPLYFIGTFTEYSNLYLRSELQIRQSVLKQYILSFKAADLPRHSFG